MENISAAMSGDEFGHLFGEYSAGPVEDLSEIEAPLQALWSGTERWSGNTADPARPLPALSGSMRVETPGGKRRIDELTQGELVLTRDRGYQQLRWRTQVATLADHEFLRLPDTVIRIAADAFGKGNPSQDLIVSASQRIMLSDVRAEALFGAEEVLVAAGDLVHLDGVDRIRCEAGERFALLFDTHEVVLSEGLWTESLLPEREVLDALPTGERAALQAAQPRLCHATGRAAYVPARMVLNSREARLLNGF